MSARQPLSMASFIAGTYTLSVESPEGVPIERAWVFDGAGELPIDNLKSANLR